MIVVCAGSINHRKHWPGRGTNSGRSRHNVTCCDFSANSSQRSQNCCRPAAPCFLLPASEKNAIHMLQDNTHLEYREPADRLSTGSVRNGLPPHPAHRVAKDQPQSQPPVNTESFTDEYGEDDIYLAYAADPAEVPQEANSK